uniref:Putative methyltransferase n=1 Tax=viral metagenome TaxID=1070528 RepID=A0A6H1ZYA6_9ZZZZ
MKLILGDCLVEMKKLQPDFDKWILITDPPYGINVDTSWLSKVNLAKQTPINKCDDKLIGDEGNTDFSWLFNFKRRFVWGFPYIYDPNATGWVVWDKQPGVARRAITSPVEMASTTLRKGFDTFRCMWGGYMRERGEKRFAHPTQKPLTVFKLPINDWTREDDLIFDPYMGSGTCAVACKELGRNFIGIEIDKGYYEIAKQRIFNTQESMF